MKKTIRIELVVDTATNTRECREMLREAIYAPAAQAVGGSHRPLREALMGVAGWSGREEALSITVSCPPRSERVRP